MNLRAPLSMPPCKPTTSDSNAIPNKYGGTDPRLCLCGIPTSSALSTVVIPLKQQQKQQIYAKLLLCQHK